MRRETQPETSGPCPLDGVRVLELGGIGPVPFCGLLLTQLGADVVRVDRPGGVPSPLTSLAGFAEADPLAAGRRSVEVDLKSSSGVQTVVALASRADILIEGWRPGVAERLGVGPAACHEANPALVYGRMTGWGQSGPLSASAGHDINYVALTGLLSAIGPADGGPVVPLNLLGDFGGGAMYLAVGVLAALHRARRTGRGDVVDAAIVDGVSHLSTMVHGLAAAGFWQEGRGRNVVDGSLPYYTVYETADGKHMAVGALEQRFFEEMCRVLEIEVPPNREDPQMHSELRERSCVSVWRGGSGNVRRPSGRGSSAVWTPACLPYAAWSRLDGTRTCEPGACSPSPVPRCPPLPLGSHAPWRSRSLPRPALGSTRRRCSRSGASPCPRLAEVQRSTAEGRDEQQGDSVREGRPGRRRHAQPPRGAQRALDRDDP